MKSFAQKKEFGKMRIIGFLKPVLLFSTLLISLVGDNLLAGQEQMEIMAHGLFLHKYFSMLGTADPVIAKMVKGEAVSAHSGEIVQFANGKAETWIDEGADSTGWFRGKYLDSAYGYFVMNSSKERVVLLEAMGDQLVYLNGVPREGNPYQDKEKWESWEPVFDYSLIPIKLKKGENEFLFLCNRGYLKVKIHDIEPCILFNSNDVTVPDFLVGQKIDYYASVVVVNATDSPLKDAYIKAYDDSGVSAETPVPVIQPTSLRKVGFKLVGSAPQSLGERKIHLVIFTKSAEASKELARTEISIKVVSVSRTHSITFISNIDGSVQYYVVVPPSGPDDGKPKALFLSFHGAGVVTANMANSYYPKTWGYIVCPTNGGPYGFDWEDWGRIDALQVLGIAKSSLPIDPSRIYLTGHSMGGHGTWMIGGQYPDQFAAIGPSAGWISWWTYVFHNDTASSPIVRMFLRATMPNRPFELSRNYKQLGVYILHGSADDNVPVTEAISMADTLGKFDHDFVFHEEVGVGHWWNKSDGAGTDCVDWPPMFDYFARHARAGEERIRGIDFTTADPGVSAKDYWLTVHAQERQLEPTRIQIRFDPSLNRFVGTTENAKVIGFDLSIADRGKPFVINLDSTKLTDVKISTDSKAVWLEKDTVGWHVTSKPSPDQKNPNRYGAFRDAFRNNVIFVYSTHGTQEENEWAFDKARFDAEYFWYQRNGSIDIVPDKDFDPAVYADRNVILYGNQKTNSAWSKVLDDEQVRVTEGEITFGKEVTRGNDYACFMVRRRKGSETASVGVVAGTGITGMRLTYVVPYLQPGFALPDLTVFNSEVLSKEFQGVKIAGFFGLDWSVASGDFVVQR